jgi:hypothetical protein
MNKIPGMNSYFKDLPNSKICIFGSRDRAIGCKRILEYRFSLKIYCFLDNDKQRQGQKFDDLITFSPKELLKIKGNAVVFVAVQRCFQKEIISQLKKMGMTKIIQYIHPCDLYFLKEILPYRESKNNLPAKISNKALSSKSAKLIAVYLPQFHAIPENNKWWGNGFTEWTNVKSVIDKPQIQSLAIPGELGYYDLSDVSVMRKQTELAKQYGVYGFCFYHYYFGKGKRLLEKPLENYLQSNIDFPFCLCWANHDWSMEWGADPDANKKMLLKQTYEDPEMHFNLILKAFKDNRYIKVNGKPLFIIWHAEGIPNILQITKLWRKLAMKAGFPDIYLLKRHTLKDGNKNPKKIGFDASIGKAPGWSIYKCSEMIDPHFKEHMVFDYNESNKHMLQKKTRYREYPAVFPRWDNTPRHKEHSIIILNSSPEKYRQWLSYAIEQVQNFKQDERIVFINAWNEWGEGMVLEPDIINGRAYLEATLAALHPKIRKLDMEMLKLLGLV